MTTLILLILNNLSIPSMGSMSLVPPESLSKGILDKKSKKNLPPNMYLLAMSLGSYISSPVFVEIYVVRKFTKMSIKKDKSMNDSITVMPIEPKMAGLKAMSRGIEMVLYMAAMMM